MSDLSRPHAEAAAAPRWRAMAPQDLAAVSAIAAAVHPAFPEDDAIFAERLALYPEGCRVLDHPEGLAGYVLTHPWRADVPPRLNTPLGALPAEATTFYLHDLALLPRARGTGAGGTVVSWLAKHATERGFATASLVAVNGSAPFWHRHGFVVVSTPALVAKLASYGASARFMVRQLGAADAAAGGAAVTRVRPR